MKTIKLYLHLLIVVSIMVLSAGCDENDKSSSDITAPTFPKTITASQGTHKERVDISWEKISNAEYYVLKRSATGYLGQFDELAYKIPSNSFYDESVAAGKSYHYKVKAVNAAGESVYGPSAEGSTMDESETEPVERPSWVTATNGTETDKVRLIWEDVAADSYNIYRADKESGIYVLLAEKNTAVTYEDYDIEIDVHYLYKVEAVKGSNSSEFSLSAEGYAGQPTELTPAEFYLILKPIIEHVWQVIDENNFEFPMEIEGAFGGMLYITMESVYDSKNTFIGSTVTLVFEDYNQDGHITNGRLVLDLDTILKGTETGTLTITGAHNATIEFNIIIGPRPDGHSSEQGGSYNITTYGDTEKIDWQAPAVTIILYPPENIKASDIDDEDGAYYGYIRITWDKSAKAVNYKVYRSETPYGAYTSIAENVELTSYDDYSIVGGKDYFYKIKACYGDIESVLSTWDKGNSTTIPGALPAPTGVSATDGTNTSSIDITWQAVTGADYYRVFRSTTADGAYSTQIGANITGTSCQDGAVTHNIQYYYKVRAYNTAYSMESELSAYDSGYAGAIVGIPSAPTNVSATDKSGNNTNVVIITWSSVDDADYYRVYRSATENGSYALIADSLTVTSYDDTTMYLDTVYYYRVKAVNESGESGYSAADQGSRQITVEEFYFDVFRPASKYAKNRIYERFPDPYIGDEATFDGDCDGTMHFKVSLYSWSLINGFRGQTLIEYNDLSDGDLNKATAGTYAQEGGIILDGTLTGLVWNGSGNGTQTGTIYVTGSHTGTCEYHLIIEDRITNGGYSIVFYNGNTETIPYENTDDE